MHSYKSILFSLVICLITASALFYCASPAYSDPYMTYKKLEETSAYLAEPDPEIYDNGWTDNPDERDGSTQLITHVLYSYPEYKLGLGTWDGIPGLDVTYQPSEGVDREAQIPLILIHGWQGKYGLTDPAELVTYDNSTEAYFSEFLQYFEDSPELQKKYRLFLYKYPSYKHITFNARMLKQLISQISYFSDHKPVIVAHSMGGLVSRSLIEEHNYDNVRALITLATPHHGSPAAIENWVDVADWFANLSTPGANDLFWDNYDGVFEWAQDDMRLNGDGRLTGAGLSDFDEKYREKSVQDGFVYENGTEVQNVGGLLYNFYLYNPFVEPVHRFPNPWLTWLNEKRKKSPSTIPYYFYGGYNYGSSTDFFNEDNISFTRYNLSSWNVFVKGYINDGVVPVTSAFLDYSKHDDFIVMGNTNSALFEHCYSDPLTNEYYKSTQCSRINQFCNHNDQRFLCRTK